MDWGNINSTIEQTETEVEDTVEKIEVIDNKEQNIKNALAQLQDDVATAGIISERLLEHQTEKQALEKKIEHYKDIAHDLEETINEMIEANNDSQAILADLMSISEDVTEGLCIITERKLLLEKCKEELQRLMEQLNMAGSFSTSSIESQIGSTEEDDGRKYGTEFVQQLQESAKKHNETDPDTTSDKNPVSSNPSGEDPSIGQRQRSTAYSTDYEHDEGILSSISALWKAKIDENILEQHQLIDNDSGHISNQILVGRIDSCVDVFGWKRKERIYSLEEDLKAVNPYFYTENGSITSDSSWRRNCQRCIIALEARFRGADVKAKPRILDGTDTLPIMKHPNGWLSVFKNPVPINCKGNTGIDTGIGVLKEMKKMGDGARAIIRVQYCDSIKVYDVSGKKLTLAVENINGKISICDGVSRLPVDISSYYPNNDLSEGIIEVERVNRNNPKIRETLLYSKKDGKFLCRVEKNSGHVFTSIQKGGKTIFCDSQSGKIIHNPEDYFAFAKRDETYAVRIDNLEFTERAKDCCESIV